MKIMRFQKQLLFLFGFSFLLLSCSTNDDTPNNTNSPQQITTTLVANTWIVKSFIDSGTDETTNFSCYSFTFNTNGTLTATSPNNTYTGTWSITNSTSNDDSASDLDFNINFNLTNDFQDLNDDWDIVTTTSNSIALIDVSGGNGGTDYLTFEIGTPTGNCSSVLQNTIENNVSTGTWRITQFIDSGVNETNNFTGYNFVFNSSGVLNANGSNNYTGNWSITNSSTSSNNLDFNINFNLTNDFQDLNDDWDFISQTPTKIELIDVSGGNGGTDYLTFEKN